MAGAVEQACLALGIGVDPARPYAPHEKGKGERLHRTIAETFAATLPGFTGGPRDERGQLEAAGELLALADLVARFAAWVGAYNAERPHRGLNGATPAQRWTGDPTPLRLVAPEDARRLLTARRAAKVQRDGVHRGGLAYVAVELAELVGEEVELAFAPYDQRWVEVYWRGEWVCAAYPHNAHSPEEQARILTERRAHAAELRRRQRRAHRQAQARLGPSTPSQPEAEEITQLPATDGHRGPRQEEALRSAARTDLLLPGGDAPRVRKR